MSTQPAYAAIGIDRPISIEASPVRHALLERGLETPLTPHQLGREAKYQRIRKAFAEIAQTLGLDLTDDSLSETPHRIARMYVDEIFAGLDYAHFPRVTAIDNKMGIEEMVKVSDISLTSTCEHHFVAIDGAATVAYLPNDKVIELSRIYRIPRFFAQRPRVQERLEPKTRAEFLA